MTALLLSMLLCAPPPATPRSDHVDEYRFGDDDVTRVADPYRWLEDLGAKRTREWVGEQNAVSKPFLDALPDRAAWIERLTRLWSTERFGVPRREGGRYFFLHNDGSQDHDVLYVADRLSATPRVLLDPADLSEDKTSSLGKYSPSPDGSLVAYAVSKGGSDRRTWHVRDVATGKDLPDVLGRTKFTDASWARDGSGFYYGRYPKGAGGRGDDSKQVSIHFHRLGTTQDEDAHVYSITDHPRRNPRAVATDDGRFLVLSVRDGYTANDVHVQRLLPTRGPVVRLLDRWDARYELLGNIGDTLFFETTKDAPRGRVVAIDFGRPEPKHWREVVPQSKEALQSASLVGGRIVANTLRDATSAVRIYDAAGSGKLEREVVLPGLGTASGFGGTAGDPETFFSFERFTEPRSIYRLDVATGEAALFRRAKADADTSAFVTRQVFFESRDKTKVPMFLVHREGLELNGDHPTVLYGYGGFNISLTPRYRTRWVAWLEAGGVLAVANLRGGGEYGEAWHEAGTLLRKQNVFDDFLAAARWLVEKRYTKPARIAAMGRSNGGLLVGATLTQEPARFGAAVPAVGVLDMLRYHTASANARQWSSDYGLSEEADQFRAQLAYSPVHNAKKGTCYPPTLITTADHDDRVVPWHSYKFAAALQHAQSCANPILLRVETRAGHGAGKPRWMRIEAEADRWAFVARALGMGR